MFSPMPPYDVLMAVGRLRLANSYERDSVPEFLSKAGQEAFVSEARIALLSEEPPILMGSSWPMKRQT